MSKFPCSSKGNQPDNSWETCPWLSRIMTNLSRVRRVTPLLHTLHTIVSSTSFPFASLISCCPLASRLLFHNSCLRGRPLPMSPLLICFGVFPAVFCRLCAQQRPPFSKPLRIVQSLCLIPNLLFCLLILSCSVPVFFLCIMLVLVVPSGKPHFQQQVQQQQHTMTQTRY